MKGRRCTGMAGRPPRCWGRLCSAALATLLPENVTRKIPTVARLDPADRGASGPDLFAEILLALVTDMRFCCDAIGCAQLTMMAACSAGLWSGGDDYDAMNDTEGKGPALLRLCARHARLAGRGCAGDARAPRARSRLSLKSNVLGLYRSHVSKDVQPADVELLLREAGL